MIRYRDGKIVSTKGERFTQVTKEESEEMKKSYVSWQPAWLRDRIKAPMLELYAKFTLPKTISKFFFQPLILPSAPLWLMDQIFNFFCFKFKFYLLLFDLLSFFPHILFLFTFYPKNCKLVKNFLIREKPRWQKCWSHKSKNFEL